MGRTWTGATAIPLPARTNPGTEHIRVRRETTRAATASQSAWHTKIPHYA